MKIVFFDSKNYDKISFEKANKDAKDEITYVTRELSMDSIERAQGHDAVCAFVNDNGSAEILEKLSKMGVKYWFQRSAGYDRVDLKAAEKFGIKVWRVPGYSPEAVAEFAWTLITAINRNIHIAYQRTHMKNFSLNGLQGETINGMTVGVIGAGRIGQAFIKIANGFGTKIIVFDEYAEKNYPESAEKFGFKYVDKKALFSNSDFISLHCPLIPSTNHIVNKDTLKLMKKHAIIVNTARGGLVHTYDLLDALDNGRIRGAGLDVYEHEAGVFFYDRSNDLIPDPALNRLRAHRNVIMTSHQSWFTNLALQQIAETTIGNIADAKKSEFSKTLQLQDNGKVLNG